MESIQYARVVTDADLLVRLDSGNDSLDNIRVCIKKGVQWIIKRNLRKESKNKWLEIAKEVGEETNPRDGKTVWRGETYRTVKGFEEPLRIVFEVAERTMDKKGQVLLVPDIEVDSV